jgi:hypothetical protein
MTAICAKETAGVDVKLLLQIATTNVETRTASGLCLSAQAPPRAVFNFQVRTMRFDAKQKFAVS